MFKNLLPQSKFARGVLTLMTGTSIAQALPILLTPILTRLYTPEDFGMLALFTSICAILVILVTSKYELAIIVPKHDTEAINLVAITFSLSLLISALLFCMILIFNDQIVALFKYPEIRQWLYLVPLSTFTIGCYHTLNYWTNRQTRYKSMAVSRVLQSGTNGVIQLITGSHRLGAAGLISGQLIGQILSTLVLARMMPSSERKLFRRISIRRMSVIARKHVNYPKYMMPGQILSVGASELPLLLLTAFYGVGIAGLYSLAQRVMGAPLSLVANAIGDVYRQASAQHYAKHGECRNIFLSSLKRLLTFAFLPVIPILFFGPSIFAFVFGENWRAAGEIAAILSILVFFQTISSPLSSTILLPGWLRLEFIWQLFRLISAGLVFYVCQFLGTDYQMVIIAHITTFSTLYMLHLYWQYQAAQIKENL